MKITNTKIKIFIIILALSMICIWTYAFTTIKSKDIKNTSKTELWQGIADLKTKINKLSHVFANYNYAILQGEHTLKVMKEEREQLKKVLQGMEKKLNYLESKLNYINSKRKG